MNLIDRDLALLWKLRTKVGVGRTKVVEENERPGAARWSEKVTAGRGGGSDKRVLQLPRADVGVQSRVRRTGHLVDNEYLMMGGRSVRKRQANDLTPPALESVKDWKVR